MKILYLGDVMGRSGRQAISEELPVLRARLKADFVVVNGENATSGMGLWWLIQRCTILKICCSVR